MLYGRGCAMAYLWVMVGSAIGGALRYAIGRWMLALGSGFPYGTLLINVVGSFVIGYFGTLTLQGGKYAASDNMRLFVMVGFCGGFTTFSSFSLQLFDSMRAGAWGRAMGNVVLSVVLCVGAVAVGHLLAQRQIGARVAVAQTSEEEFTG